MTDDTNPEDRGDLPDGLDFGFQIFDEATGPRVSHHRSHCEHAPWRFSCAKSFDQHLFIKGYKFSDFGRHRILLFAAGQLS